MNSFREIKQLILFTLSLPTSIFGEHHSNGYVSYTFLYNRLPLRRASVRNAVCQLVKSGEVNKIVSNQQPLLALSALGRKRLYQLMPALFPVGQSKFGFLLALFLGKAGKAEVEKVDKKARYVRQYLTQLGFIKIQRGVYCGWQALSHEAEAMIMKHGLAHQVLLIPFQEALFFKASEISYKLLKFQDLSVGCLKLVNQINKLLRENKEQKSLSGKANSMVRSVWQQGFWWLKKMPALPRSLVPPHWPVEELKTKLKLLSESL